MVTILLTLALLSSMAGDTIAPAVPRIRPFPATVVTGYGVITLEGDSVASMDVPARVVRPPIVNAYGEYMSVGPFGREEEREERGTLMTLVRRVVHRMRVTLSRSWYSVALFVDDIEISAEDSRSVAREYRITVSPGLPDGAVGELVKRRARVQWPEPAGPPIVWLNATSFAWITRSDTLVFEQRADSLFRLTVRARLR